MTLNLQSVSRAIAEFAFLSAVLCNSLLIYLTGWKTENITGTYKYMIIIFSVLGLTFSCNEMIAQPFVHDFNEAFIYFSVSKELSEWRPLVIILCLSYAGIYAALISSVAVQFIYRYLTLVNTEWLFTLFNGWKILIWLSYITICGFIWSALVYLCGTPDVYSTGYIREEFESIYNIDIQKSAVFIIVAYEPDAVGESRVRWSSVIFTIGVATILVTQYAIMIFCGISMHLQMAEKLKNFSVANQRLERQFFKVLVLQITVPTVLFHVPIFPVLLAPFFDSQISFQSGIIYSLFSLYPPVDALILLCVVSEYRNALSALLGRPTAVGPAENNIVRTVAGPTVHMV